MLLTRIHLRHYKSFNYDYERKAKPNALREPWETDADGWQPFVRVALESDITAIVGANESGKSHLLDAIEVLLDRRTYDQNDFCRYSSLYSVEAGQRRWPQFAGEFEVDQTERAALDSLELPLRGDNVVLIVRRSPATWASVDRDGEEHLLADDRVAELTALLPTSFRLTTDLPLPDSLSIRALAKQTPLPDRPARTGVVRVFADSPPATPEAIPALAQPLFAALQLRPAVSDEDPARAAMAHQLGESLLTHIARIDPAVFTELEEAVLHYREGTVNGLIQKMNESLSRHLNLHRWWRQDSRFSLRVSLREYELVFTIHDRTGTDYSFAERSTGLRYFLSYFVQLRAHVPLDERPELLLMDEPDTFLSAAGQQDLLRVLEQYATPEGMPSDRRVVYVTHSPFLLNKNAVRRARVIDKGAGEEGTRLVRDASQNRYEPLRSAIGAFVAETAFIGGSNLFLEGASDQVYLTEMSNRLRAGGAAPSTLLDLNATTLVVSGSAGQIPYMVYLARGQDEIKPPCVVLLDSDDAGIAAERSLRRGGAQGRQVLDPRWVRMLGKVTGNNGEQIRVPEGVTVRDIEDLIPPALAVTAARSYAVSFVGLPFHEAAALTLADVTAALPEHNGSVYDAIESLFTSHFNADIDKVGLAKEFLRVLRTVPPTDPDVQQVEANFSALIGELATLLRDAEEAEDTARRSKRLNRLIERFLDEHPDPVTRDTAQVMLRDADSAAGESEQGDTIRAAIASIRRDFAIDIDPLQPIEDWERFRERVAAIRYTARLALQEQAQPSLPEDQAEPAGADAPLLTASRRRPRSQRSVESEPAPATSFATEE